MGTFSTSISASNFKSYILAKWSIFLISACLLCSCNTLSRQPDTATVTLLAGESKIIFRDGRTSVKVTGIQDSRCPKDVQCVWEGYVSTDLEMSNSNGEKASFTLCSGKCDQAGINTKLNVLLGVKTFEVTLIGVSDSGAVTLKVNKI